ncbi:MAG: hypothetical protein FJ387_28735 [Verrucomicrobia bacterium]|nr:hypothetical protein [Verrucomicrobiota bacterium]
MKLLQRREPAAAVKAALARAPVTALLGPRQAAKTTLARQIAVAISGPLTPARNSTCSWCGASSDTDSSSSGATPRR